MTGGGLRIIVAGYVVRGPLGGIAWHHLQYVLGLMQLGHEVWFLEDSGDYPMCYDPRRLEVGADPSYGIAFAARVFERAGIGARWAYHDAFSGRWLGPAAATLRRDCERADMFINVSGVNALRPWVAGIPVRVMIDTDPVFTQIDFIEDPEKSRLADGHTAFFSFGENVGRPGCTMPDDGRPWRPTRQPVVLSAWPVTPAHPEGDYTTVMLWDSYEPRRHGGRDFGMKSVSMDAVIDLPVRSGRRFELALGGPTAPMQRLLDAGWRLRDPIGTTSDPWTYQAYLQRSKAEFSVAKHGYVASHSGWFSERSCGYLASGRPVVTQDTGFTRLLPSGDGLLAWRTPEEAVAAVAEVDARYAHHCEAARALVEQHFDARQVLQRLLDAALAAPVRAPALQGTA